MSMASTQDSNISVYSPTTDSFVRVGRSPGIERFSQLTESIAELSSMLAYYEPSATESAAERGSGVSSSSEDGWVEDSSPDDAGEGREPASCYNVRMFIQRVSAGADISGGVHDTQSPVYTCQACRRHFARQAAECRGGVGCELEPGDSAEIQGRPEDEKRGCPENEERGSLEDEIRGSLEDEIRGSPEEEKRGSPEEEKRGNIEDEIRGSIEDEIRGSIEDEIRGSIEDEIRGSPEDEIRGSPEDEIRGSPADEIRGSPEDEIPRSTTEPKLSFVERESEAERAASLKIESPASFTKQEARNLQDRNGFTSSRDCSGPAKFRSTESDARNECCVNPLIKQGRGLTVHEEMEVNSTEMEPATCEQPRAKTTYLSSSMKKQAANSKDKESQSGCLISVIDLTAIDDLELPSASQKYEEKHQAKRASIVLVDLTDSDDQESFPVSQKTVELNRINCSSAGKDCLARALSGADNLKNKCHGDLEKTQRTIKRCGSKIASVRLLESKHDSNEQHQASENSMIVYQLKDAVHSTQIDLENPVSVAILASSQDHESNDLQNESLKGPSGLSVPHEDPAFAKESTMEVDVENAAGFSGKDRFSRQCIPKLDAVAALDLNEEAADLPDNRTSVPEADPVAVGIDEKAVHPIDSRIGALEDLKNESLKGPSDSSIPHEDPTFAEESTMEVDVESAAGFSEKVSDSAPSTPCTPKIDAIAALDLNEEAADLPDNRKSVPEADPVAVVGIDEKAAHPTDCRIGVL